MDTRILTVSPGAAEVEVIDQAAAVLRDGGLVAFPTETVYGLGANALDAAAVARIFTAKGRPAHNPLIVHLADAADVARVAAAWPENAALLARHFWPGPLTLVLPRRPDLPDIVTGGGPTVAVRVPAHPVARALVRASGVPVAAPSANRSNQLSPTRAEHVLRDLNGRIDLILDGGPTPNGIESTVVSVIGQPRLLRPGPIEAAALEALVGPLATAPQAAPLGMASPSPGMQARHYAPRTPLEAVEGDGRERVRALAEAGLRVAWVTTFTPDVSWPGVVSCVLPDDPVRCAAQLYGVLHDLDAQGFDRIVAALPPDTGPWQAVRDRLRRAGGSG